jgi:hypothetical protein
MFHLVNDAYDEVVQKTEQNALIEMISAQTYVMITLNRESLKVKVTDEHRINVRKQTKRTHPQLMKIAALI